MDFDIMAVARAIRRVRKERGLSQEVLSGLSGIARTHLTMIESGSMQPNLRTIWKIAGALDLRPSELVVLIEKEAEGHGGE